MEGIVGSLLVCLLGAWLLATLPHDAHVHLVGFVGGFLVVGGLTTFLMCLGHYALNRK